jgi:hypothetical protein
MWGNFEYFTFAEDDDKRKGSKTRSRSVKIITDPDAGG